MAIPEITEQIREEHQDSEIERFQKQMAQFRERTVCIIHQLNERIDFLEVNNGYLMQWIVKHDNEVARNRSVRRHALSSGGKRGQAKEKKKR